MYTFLHHLDLIHAILGDIFILISRQEMCDRVRGNQEQKVIQLFSVSGILQAPLRQKPEATPGIL